MNESHIVEYMGAAASVIVETILPEVISLLANEAVKLLSGVEANVKPKKTLLLANNPNEDYSIIDNDTGKYAEDIYQGHLGYIWSSINTNCLIPHAIDGHAYSSMQDFVVYDSIKDTATTVTNYMNSTLDIPDVTGRSNIYKSITDTVLALVSKGNSDWEALSHTYTVPPGDSGYELAVDVLFVYATVANNEGGKTTCLQYRGTCYKTEPFASKSMVNGVKLSIGKPIREPITTIAVATLIFSVAGLVSAVAASILLNRPANVELNANDTDGFTLKITVNQDYGSDSGRLRTDKPITYDQAVKLVNPVILKSLISTGAKVDTKSITWSKQ